jgi:hypothetical protein
MGRVSGRPVGPVAIRKFGGCGDAAALIRCGVGSSGHLPPRVLRNVDGPASDLSA